jgi:two-component system, chemotaxis family, chemotaxis protein CheY
MRPVLIIEDDNAIQDFISLTLEDEGYGILTASDGTKALQLLASEVPALILLDIRMPNMDGYAFIDAYRQMQVPQAPIVVVSAGRNVEDAIVGLGVAGFLAKPFNLDQLLTLIYKHVGT